MHPLRGIPVGSLLVALYCGLSLTLTHVQIADAVVDAEIYGLRSGIQCSPMGFSLSLAG